MSQLAGGCGLRRSLSSERWSNILGMVEEGNHVAAKLRFHGLHRKPLFGVHPAGAIFGGTERPYLLSRDRR